MTEITVTLNGTDLGCVESINYIDSISTMHLNSVGHPTSDAMGQDTSGVLRVISISGSRENIPTATNAFFINRIRSYMAVFQAQEGPYTLVISDASNNWPSETINVIISNFTVRHETTNTIAYDITLLEVADWL